MCNEGDIGKAEIQGVKIICKEIDSWGRTQLGSIKSAIDVGAYLEQKGCTKSIYKLWAALRSPTFDCSGAPDKRAFEMKGSHNVSLEGCKMM